MNEFLWITMVMSVIMIIIMNIMLYHRGGIFKPEDDWCCSGIERGKCKICKMVGMNKYHRPFRVPVYTIMMGIVLMPIIITVAMMGINPDTMYAIGVVGVSAVVVPMIFIGLNDKLDEIWKWWSGKDVLRR